MMPLVSIRPLTVADIPQLTQINPTFRSGTELTVIRTGTGLEVGWQLQERTLTTPYDKGHGYDFDLERRHDIAQHLAEVDTRYLRVAERVIPGREGEAQARLVGLADAGYDEGNNAVTLDTLFIDISARGQGLGRRLFDLVVRYARECGAQAVLITTQTNNVPAARFYERMGCRLAGLHDALYDRALMETALHFEYPLIARQ